MVTYFVKNNQTTETGPKFYVRIDRSERLTVTRHRNPDEQWSGQHDIKAHELNGFDVVDEHSSWDFILPYNPEGQSLYLVYALYDDGDSFNRHENLIDMVSLVRNMEDAKAILAALTKDYKDYQDGTQDRYGHKPLQIHLPVEDRIEELYTGTWKGYFAHLRELRIESLGGGMSVKFD